MEPFLVCQKKFWQKDPNLPLPLSFGVSKFFWQAKCIIAKEQLFLLHLAFPKNLETPKLSGNGRLGSFVKIFSGRPRMAP
ncbi:unnamed protein product [Blepharisma stoltei]|uniref:Uncharacterized protein n=1 Tax=Blepharisma stoltei TaxID=1481888 RepID=A0AAU9JQG1_9CILI|nr:unnamed protein product [Blepharisma stoltei]